MGEENTEAFATPEERGDFVEPQETEDKKDDEPTAEEMADVTGEKSSTENNDKESGDEGDKGATDSGENLADKDTETEDETPDVEDKNKGIRVPKFRLDAALTRAREAEKKLNELVDKQASTKKEETPSETPEQVLDTKLSEIDAKIADAMADGDNKLITSLMAESRQAEREYITSVMTEQNQQVQAKTADEMREELKLDAVLTELETEYPMFDGESDQFDQDANDYVLRLQRAFIAEGSTASDALVEAVNYALPALGLVKESTETTESVEDVKADVPGKPATRTKENIDAANRQPPDTDDVGDDSNTTGQQDALPNSMELTEAEYDALPEDTKRRMRGDFA